MKKIRKIIGLMILISALPSSCKETGKEIAETAVNEISETIIDESIEKFTEIGKNAKAQNENQKNISESDEQLYEEINENIPLFTDAEKSRTDAFEIYSELDELGRCGTAYANVCKELMPTEERGEIGMIKPTGWHTVKYNCVEGKYLYNRCHLIAFCLAGENANEKNLITGTRYFNVQGMLPYETMVAEYIDENPQNHVLYRVTPVFNDNNLIADGVQMEGWSVEDNGTGICFNVFIRNIQPGVKINYETGESCLN